jgi:uncharacterized protein (TIGR04255 family)
MAKQRHLTKAPIVEAIIDFRVKLPSGYKVTNLLSLQKKLSKSYPQVEERRAFEGGLRLKDKEVEQILKDRGLQGYFFKSHDEKCVVQFRKDGFTFSRLSPYTNWEKVSAEAKTLWELYAKTAKPELITRLATRYINRMDLPLPMDDFNQYLTAPPTIPESLPQDVSHFLSRLTLHDPKLDLVAHVTQALEKSLKPDHIAILLDIDVFKQMDLGFPESDIWPTFEKLHDFKNRIFFDNIQEKTARLFE